MLVFVGSPSPATAAPSFKDIDVQVWAYICDDEVIDRRDNCGEHRMTSRPLKVPTAAGKWMWTACQGREVWVHVELTTKHLPGGKAEVQASLLYLEAAFGCNNDIEGRANQKVVITEGERAVMNFFFGKAEKGHDGAAVQVILNDKVKI
jgi:hypothetical protein